MERGSSQSAVRCEFGAPRVPRSLSTRLVLVLWLAIHAPAVALEPSNIALLPSGEIIALEGRAGRIFVLTDDGALKPLQLQARPLRLCRGADGRVRLLTWGLAGWNEIDGVENERALRTRAVDLATAESAAQLLESASGYPAAVLRDGALLTIDPIATERIVKIALDGTVVDWTLAVVPGAPPHQSPPGRIDLRRGAMLPTSEGRVFATSGETCIVEIEFGVGVRLVAGGAMPGYADGPASEARFSSPQGLCLAADGALLVADTGNRRIRRIAADGEVTTLATLGWKSQPADLAIMADGRIVILSLEPERIEILALAGASAAAGADTEASTPQRLATYGDVPAWYFLAPAIFMTVIVLVFLMGGATIVHRRRLTPGSRREPVAP